MIKNKQSALFIIPKSTYYNSKEEVIKNAEMLHDEIFKEDRELYTYLLYFENSTYFSKSLIIEKLLSNSLYNPKYKELLNKEPMLAEIEELLILNILYNENITHAFKILLRLKEKRVNNARTKRIILRFIFDRDNTDYIAIKYKNKIKQLLVHALGLKTVYDILERRKNWEKIFEKWIGIYNNPYSLEVFDFVFNKEREYTSKYFKEYIRVKEDFENDTIDFSEPVNLPKEVVEGFNNFYQRDVNFSTIIAMTNTSDKQKIQLQNTVKRHSNNKFELDIDFNKYNLIELYKYLYNKNDLSKEEHEEIIETIHKKALKIREKIDFDFTNTATVIIVDLSDSNYGSEENRLNPLYKNLILAEVFSDEAFIIPVGGNINERGLYEPMGDTNLTEGLLQAVELLQAIEETGCKNIIILSDGFENVGNFDKTYKQLKKIGYNLNVIHLNPVFSPKNMEFKTISDSVITIPYFSEEDIQYMELFYLLNTSPEKFKEKMKEKIEEKLKEE